MLDGGTAAATEGSGAGHGVRDLILLNESAALLVDVARDGDDERRQTTCANVHSTELINGL